MDREQIRRLLDEVARGRRGVEEALDSLAELPFQLGGPTTTVDTHRELRCGFPEVIYSAGKSPQQVAEAFVRLARAHDRVLATRAEPAHFAAVQAALPAAVHHGAGRCIAWRRDPAPKPRGAACVVTAGTSDHGVAEEAAITLELMDAAVTRIHDVGVAGLHRLLPHLERLRRADAVVVCAGMEGALPSVVGGLIPTPIVAVPTSVGYGASFGGLTALLSMLNSCAAGVGVVNVDNGFGAGYLAGLIVRSATAGRANARAEIHPEAGTAASETASQRKEP